MDRVIIALLNYSLIKGLAGVVIHGYQILHMAVVTDLIIDRLSMDSRSCLFWF